jgi:hypothetical protein
MVHTALPSIKVPSQAVNFYGSLMKVALWNYSFFDHGASHQIASSLLHNLKWTVFSALAERLLQARLELHGFDAEALLLLP